jgi:hypothetical protein
LLATPAAGPLRLRRRVRFEPEAIIVHDELAADAPLLVRRLALPRGFVAIHSGSARYFASSDATATQAPPLEPAAEALRRSGRATVEFTIRVRTTQPHDAGGRA